MIFPWYETECFKKKKLVPIHEKKKKKQIKNKTKYTLIGLLFSVLFFRFIIFFALTSHPPSISLCLSYYSILMLLKNCTDLFMYTANQSYIQNMSYLFRVFVRACAFLFVFIELKSVPFWYISSHNTRFLFDLELIRQV